MRLVNEKPRKMSVGKYSGERLGKNEHRLKRAFTCSKWIELSGRGPGMIHEFSGKGG